MSLRKALFVSFALLGSCAGSDKGVQTKTVVEPAEDLDARAARLAKETIIVDGHIDLPMRLHSILDAGKPLPDLTQVGEEGDFDGARAAAGGLDAPFMSIYIPAKLQKEGGAKKLADELIDIVESIVTRHPQQFALADSPTKVESNFHEGRISLLMGIENGAALEDDLANVEHFFNRGVRYITLTHSKDNLICDSSYDDTHTWKGLSDYGVKVVLEMNRLGVLVDVSHVSDQAFYDVMKVTTKPVIASHSSMRHFTPGFERNMNDDMVRVLADNGGVVMINFGSTFIWQESIAYSSKLRKAVKAFKGSKGATEEAVEKFVEEWTTESPFPFATVEHVADHIDHVVQLVGIKHVGLGSDFDGVGDSLPIGLKDAGGYPRLFRALLDRGYSDEDIKKLASDNVLRVWRAQNGL